MAPRAARAPATPVEQELFDLTRRFRLAVRVTVLVVVAALGDHIPGVPLAYIASPRFWVWFQLVLSVPIVFWCGAPIFREALSASVRGRADRSTPIALAVAGLWIWSVVAAVRPDSFPLAYLDQSLQPFLYFQHATVLVTLVLVARVIEGRARLRPVAAIEAMRALVPRSARRLGANGLEQDAAIGTLAPGDSVRVWIGEPMPVDGVVLEGKSGLDESRITGAARLRGVGPDDLVIGGAINREGGPLLIRVEREASDPLLARLVAGLKGAIASRGAMDRLAERCGAWMALVVLLAGAATFTLWVSRGADVKWTLGLLNAAAVLVVVPGVFALAARSSITGAILRGATSGVIFRDAAAIETLRDADTLVALVNEPLEEGGVETLRALRASGLRVTLWSLDDTALPVLPEAFGIEVVSAPESSDAAAAALAALRAEKRIVATVSTAGHADRMTPAHVGIALLSGFEDAPPQAGVVLPRGDLRGVLRARRLAKAAVANQKQGLLFVFAYAALAIPVAAGALFPYLGFLVDPMIAAAAAGWCTVMVLANALRLRWEDL